MPAAPRYVAALWLIAHATACDRPSPPGGAGHADDEPADGGGRVDRDGDGIADADDLCPDTADPAQRDFDGDLRGDVCDADADGDGADDPPPAPGALAWVDALDFLLQDVCVDDAGAPVAADPVDCRTAGLRARSVRLDEALLVHMHDRPDSANPRGFQMAASVPLRLAGGEIGVLHRFDFGGGDDRRAFLEFDRVGDFSSTEPGHGAPIDGYDVLELSRPFASYIATCDPVGRVQPMFAWQGGVPGACVFDDAWLVADLGALTPASPGSALARLRIAPACPGDFLVPAFTVWELRPVTYSSGKTIESLVSTHYGGADPATADHFERFYYTRPYGRARWERWNRGGVAHVPPCDGPTEDSGFVRVDCRDWTFAELAADDGYDLRAWPVDSRVARGNLLVNHDFGATTTFLGPWIRTDDATLSRSILEETGGARGRNRFLAMSWTGAGARSIHQDVARAAIPAGARVGFGARMWSDGEGKTPAQIAIRQLRADGSEISATAIPVAAATARRRVEGSFVVAADAVLFRFDVSLDAPGRIYALDDAWLTRL